MSQGQEVWQCPPRFLWLISNVIWKKLCWLCLKSRSPAFMAKLDFCRWKFLRQRISRLPLGLDVGFRTNSLLLDFPSVDSLFCLVSFFSYSCISGVESLCVSRIGAPPLPTRAGCPSSPVCFLLRERTPYIMGTKGFKQSLESDISIDFLLQERIPYIVYNIAILWGPEDSN